MDKASVWDEIHSRLWVLPMSAGCLGAFLLMPGRFHCTFTGQRHRVNWNPFSGWEVTGNDEETGSV